MGALNCIDLQMNPHIFIARKHVPVKKTSKQATREKPITGYLLVELLEQATLSSLVEIKPHEKQH